MSHKHLPCGAVKSPPNTEPAPCYPSMPTSRCEECSRHRGGHAPRAEDRPTLVVIDGSVTTLGRCELFRAWPYALEAA